VHWGNAGFRVDASLHHPRRPQDAVLGVMVDFARYPQAEDPVRWDVFRGGIHAWQGWTMHRVWTPQLFRDLAGTVDQVHVAAASRVPPPPEDNSSSEE
jgi:very-short-patch-repair endonuclease